MEFSKDALDHVIHLSHLRVAPEKKDAYLKQLQDILKYMDKLNALDLSDTDAATHSIEASTPLREDVVVESGDLLLEKNAPKWDDHAFEVPQILGGDD